MGAGAIAVAVGPLIGGIATTYFSWRWVFVGEVLVVVGILVLARRIHDTPAEARRRFDVLGAVLAAVGLGAGGARDPAIRRVGLGAAEAGRSSLLGVSLTVWFVLAGLLVIWVFVERESRLEAAGGEPLVKPSLFGNRQMTGGLLMFFVLYLVQAGLFFTIPLFLSVSLGLSALDTGVRILPLSVTLLAAAVGIPRFFPNASPRRVVRLGLPRHVRRRRGAHVGHRSQRRRPDRDGPAAAGRVGHRGARFAAGRGDRVRGTRRAEPGGGRPAEHRHEPGRGHRYGVGRLAAHHRSHTSFLQSIAENPAVPEEVKSQATVQLEGGVPFLSDAALQDALVRAGVDPAVTDAALDANRQARVDGLKSALTVLAMIALVGLFVARRVPDRPPRSIAGASPAETDTR